MSSRKLILFVDCSNFYHVLKENSINPNSVDCNKFFEKICRKENPTVRFYDALKTKDHGMRQQANQQHFHAELKRNPNLTLHFGRLQPNKNFSPENMSLLHKQLKFCENCKKKIKDLLIALGVYKKHREKGVDVRIAVDLMRLAREEDGYDIAILLSGDADLAPAVQYVVEKEKKRVINAYFWKNSGKELRDVSSSCFLINPINLKDCMK